MSAFGAQQDRCVFCQCLLARLSLCQSCVFSEREDGSLGRLAGPAFLLVFDSTLRGKPATGRFCASGSWLTIFQVSTVSPWPRREHLSTCLLGCLLACLLACSLADSEASLHGPFFLVFVLVLLRLSPCTLPFSARGCHAQTLN